MKIHQDHRNKDKLGRVILVDDGHTDNLWVVDVFTGTTANDGQRHMGNQFRMNGPLPALPVNYGVGVEIYPFAGRKAPRSSYELAGSFAFNIATLAGGRIIQSDQPTTKLLRRGDWRLRGSAGSTWYKDKLISNPQYSTLWEELARVLAWVDKLSVKTPLRQAMSNEVDAARRIAQEYWDKYRGYEAKYLSAQERFANFLDS